MENQPTPVRILLGIITTLAVMALAIVPPILHFFTGPIGPGIGGYISGRLFRLNDREALIMGIGLALVAGVPAYFVLNGLVTGSTAFIAAGIAALWSGGLATVAAWFAHGDEVHEASPEL